MDVRMQHRAHIGCLTQNYDSQKKVGKLILPYYYELGKTSFRAGYRMWKLIFN
jgi:hypothetical protein